MIKLAPSLLASDYLRFGEELEKVISSGADALHYDVMDGTFVPAITFGQELLSKLSKRGFPIDAHLMITNPEKQIDSFLKAGASYITIHQEAANFNTKDALKAIRAGGCKAGVSIKPYTSVKAIEDVLEYADLVLIMTVEPGKGGQKLIPFTLDKVKELKKLCAEAGVSPIIEVDGGINEETAPLAVSAGADMLVAGSAFFKAKDPKQFAMKLKSIQQ